MNTRYLQIILATAILTMREDCNDLEDWLTVLSSVGDLIEANGGLRTLIEVFEGDEHYEVPLLKVYGGDLILLALLYVIELHKDGLDCTWVIPYIRSGLDYSLNDRVRTAAKFTLGILGDPVAQRGRETALAKLNLPSVEYYEAGTIRNTLFDMVNGCQK